MKSRVRVKRKREKLLLLESHVIDQFHPVDPDGQRADCPPSGSFDRLEGIEFGEGNIVDDRTRATSLYDFAHLLFDPGADDKP